MNIGSSVEPGLPNTARRLKARSSANTASRTVGEGIEAVMAAAWQVQQGERRQ